MMNSSILVLLVFFATVTLAPPVQAQVLQLGKWAGTMTLPGTAPVDINFDVQKTEEGSLSITIRHGESRYPLNNITVKKSQLTFSWVPGDKTVHCKMEKQQDNSRYLGECTFPEGGPALLLTMTTPRADKKREN